MLLEAAGISPAGGIIMFMPMLPNIKGIIPGGTAQGGMNGGMNGGMEQPNMLGKKPPEGGSGMVIPGPTGPQRLP
jgi:hypothetical protein